MNSERRKRLQGSSAGPITHPPSSDTETEHLTVLEAYGGPIKNPPFIHTRAEQLLALDQHVRTFEEHYSFMAWHDFKEKGRGAIVIFEEHSVYWARATLAGVLGGYKGRSVRELFDSINSYDPQTEINILFIAEEPENPTRVCFPCGKIRPRTPPPLAKRDAGHTGYGEPRH